MRDISTRSENQAPPGTKALSGENAVPPWFRLVAILLAAAPSLYTASYSLSYSVASYEDDASDALIFRTCAELLMDGNNPYRASARNQHIAQTRLRGNSPPYDLQFAYPPNALPLFLLYGIGSPRTGFICFVALSTIVLLLATDRWARRITTRWYDHVLVVIAMGVFRATWFNALLGQTGAWLATTVILFCLWYPRREALAGIALGLMAFKPQYAVVLALLPLMEKRWKIVAYSAGTFVASALASGILFGFSLWADFLAAVFEANHTITDMCNWLGLLHTAFGSLPREAQSWSVIVLLIGLSSLAVMQRALLKEGCPPIIICGILIAASSVISPNSHPYDLIMWVIPISLFARLWQLPVALPLIIIGLAFGEMPRNLMPLVSLLFAGALIAGRNSSRVSPVHVHA